MFEISTRFSHVDCGMLFARIFAQNRCLATTELGHMLRQMADED